ncbi:MAG: hypothetical protein LBC31_08835 [Treponema sp.]|jgi:hypothetical protein|nr:hypothetical protein [Treponema sp.]
MIYRLFPRKLSYLVFALTALILGACMSYPVNIERFAKEVIIWDETFPKEESVGLFISPFVQVTTYNGISVDWKGNRAVYLPPGKTNLTVNFMNRDSWGISSWKKDLPFEWTFQAGDRYTLMDEVEWGVFPVLILQNMNEKIAWGDQLKYRFPSPKLVLSPPIRNQGSQGSATLVFGESLIIRGYNDMDVYREMYPTGTWKVNKVTVPAGGTSVNFDYRHYMDRFGTDVVVYGQNIELNYNFEDGKEYTIAAYQKRLDPITLEYGVAVWDYASSNGKPGALQRGKMMVSWKLGEDKLGEQ